ncbi:MAG: PAS domain S-box protein, partial [Candidatus Latescibacteria bacterium]|nr:PAS domain S-box protein [bacterium]MBD3424679.1 PAS domain S-box protein [Candidatus Latescibacterota bacterium]
IISGVYSEEGLCSLAVLPVSVGQEVIACINIASHSRESIGIELERALEDIRPAVARTIDRIWSRWNLLRSERKYRAVFDNIYQFTALVTTDGRVVEVNRATRGFVDREEEEILGNLISESHVFKTVPGLPQKIAEGLERVSNGETVRFETVIQDDSGRKYNIDFSMRPVLTDSGEVELIVLEGRDISEHVQLTRALKESEESYHTIFDSVEDAIFIHELSTARVIDVNQKMIEMYGYESKEDVLGKTLEHFSSGNYPYCKEFIQEKLARVESVLPMSMEWHARRKDGSLLWVEVNAKIVRILGEDRLLAVVKDITERKRVEEELRSSEKKYRNIVENSHESILIIGDNYKLEFANNRAMELLGREKEEVLGHDFREFLDEESARLVTERYTRRRMGEEVPKRYEFSIITKEGASRRVEISTSIFRMDDRLISMALILDITEREEAEKRFRTLFESSRDALLIMHPDDLRFEEVNPAAMELFSVDSREQFYSLTPADISPESQPDGRNSKEKSREMVDLAIREGSSFFEWVHLGAEEKHLYCTVFLVRVELGGEVYIMATVRDITRNKQAEWELESLRDYLRDIFDSMPSVLIGVDAEGTVTQWNEEAKRVTGLAPARVMGRPLQEVYPALTPKLGLVKEAISEESPRKDLRAVRHVDGETYYKDIMIFPVLRRGNREAMIREDDVTDKVHFEEMIVQSEKMLSLGGFAAGMAHEINNPLAVIIQNASVISDRLTGDMPANRNAARELGVDFGDIREYVNRREINEMTETIIDFGKRAASVVRGMLSFSRKGGIEKAGVDINEILEEAVELARKDISLDFDSIELKTELSSGLPPIFCERNKMVQAILNIIKNAAESLIFLESSERKMSIESRMDGGRVCVRIWDNGQGIDNETIKHVFEPFYTTKKEKGIGLGLSIAYFIITESYAGTIDVRSEEGKWTEFVITLPVE